MSFARQMAAGVLLAAMTGAAWGQVSLPAPQEFYFDPDPAAEPMVAIEGESGDLVNQLVRLRERGRRAVEATVQLATIAIGEGRTDLGQTLYDEALQETSTTSQQGRGVRWNHGWMLFRQGQAEAALEQWYAAAEGMRGNPSWLPPTYALVLWRLGRSNEAVAWYAAAVRTEPTLWSTTEHHAELLPGWQDDERATLAEVQQAWAVNPPAWP